MYADRVGQTILGNMEIELAAPVQPNATDREAQDGRSYQGHRGNW